MKRGRKRGSGVSGVVKVSASLAASGSQRGKRSREEDPGTSTHARRRVGGRLSGEPVEAEEDDRGEEQEDEVSEWEQLPPELLAEEALPPPRATVNDAQPPLPLPSKNLTKAERMKRAMSLLVGECLSSHF